MHPKQRASGLAALLVAVNYPADPRELRGSGRAEEPGGSPAMMLRRYLQYLGRLLLLALLLLWIGTTLGAPPTATLLADASTHNSSR